MIINLHKIIRCTQVILYFFIINSSVYTQNKSYFFTNEQSNAIFDKLNNRNKENKKQNKKKVQEYKLSGICYLSIDNWVVWINGQSYNKIGQYSQFSIDAVTPDSVIITTLDCKTIHLTVKCDNICVVSKNIENIVDSDNSNTKISCSVNDNVITNNNEVSNNNIQNSNCNINNLSNNITSDENNNTDNTNDNAITNNTFDKTNNI